MNALILIVITFCGYLLAYHSYGRYLADKIFQLNPNRRTPAHEFNDGKDYVPSKKSVIFGHHFASIAGTGPIVGPAIGVIWGWGPALLWIVFGSIFMGAVHDFTALVMSLRHQGQSISELTAEYVNPRVRFIFFIIVFLALWIVIAIFGLIIALIFNMFPESVFPVWMEIPIALGLGVFLAKKKIGLLPGTVIAVALMYVTVVIGHVLPITMPDLWGMSSIGVWTVILLAYAFVASVLPVTRLLQPRDYINAWQLYIALGLLCGGVLVSGFLGDLRMTAPLINLNPVGAPPILPFLFITIACGAVSGFHSLVSSGTTSKQIQNETDAKMVGYGSMLVEAGLATLVLVAVTAGLGLMYMGQDGTVLTGISAWETHYSSWTASAGLGSKLDAVVVGMANILRYVMIPRELGMVIVGVFIASFAGTTLDTSTRIQRYIVTELLSRSQLRWGANKWLTTGIAVISAALLAFSSGTAGKGALTLWPMFGAVNQLLAALALMIGTVYLRKKGGRAYLLTGLPCLFMLAVTIWAVILNQLRFIQDDLILLAMINGLVLCLSIWVSIEVAVILLFKSQGRRTLGFESN